MIKNILYLHESLHSSNLWNECVDLIILLLCLRFSYLTWQGEISVDSCEIFLEVKFWEECQSFIKGDRGPQEKLEFFRIIQVWAADYLLNKEVQQVRSLPCNFAILFVLHSNISLEVYLPSVSEESKEHRDLGILWQVHFWTSGIPCTSWKSQTGLSHQTPAFFNHKQKLTKIVYTICLPPFG